MKRIYFESFCSCVINASLLILNIILGLRDISIWIPNTIFIAVLIAELLLYLRKSPNERKQYSLVYFCTSSFFTLIFFVSTLYYLHSICPSYYIERAKVYIRFAPYIYLYPIFIYSSGIALVKYSNISKIKKALLILVALLITLVIPQLLYR